MWWTRLSSLILVMTTVVLVAAACAEEPEPREPTPEFDPTPAPAGAVIDTPTAAAAGTPSTEPTPTPASGGAGDPAAGEQVFQANGCSACHSTGENTIVGPGLAGLAEQAGERVAGLSAEEYILQSIVEPGAHIVEGFSDVMPKNFGDQIPEEDLRDLVAYLETLE